MSAERRWTERVHDRYRRTKMPGQQHFPPPGSVLAACQVCNADGPHRVIADHGDSLRALCVNCGSHVHVAVG